MYKFKLKENEYGPKGFEVGDVKVKDGTQSTVTDVNATTGAITWDLENVGAFDTVYKTFDELNQLLKTLESGGEAKSDSVIDSIADNVKNLFNQYRTHIRKNYPESWEKVKLVRESNQSEWEAIDVSRTAEKELSNKEWNERTAKKLAILKSLNDEGKFKKKWDEEKLQGWVDKNYSWEKVSLQSISEELSIGGKKVKTIKNAYNLIFERLIATLVSILRKAHVTSISMENRCFGIYKDRTNLVKIKFKPWDVAFIVLSSILFIGVILYLFHFTPFPQVPSSYSIFQRYINV